MRAVHEVLGIGVFAFNALAAAWGGVSWWRRNPSVAFWPILRAAQALVVIEAITGGIELLNHHKPPDKLHYLYGLLPLVFSLVAEGMRQGAAHAELAAVEDPDALGRREQVLLARRIVIREMAIMSVSALATVTVAIRAAQSGGLF